ncbi:MAG TPA: helix-turn-helix domain-containing protein [Kofleriaceae bacterium]|nr:helix-turn-helix domain-containing protein [Kofleriaceae bacterium]
MYSVLIVDDEPFVRLSLVGLHPSGAGGFDFVAEAGNGAEALAVLRARPEIDILLLDLSMPVMDGLEVLRRLRVEPPPRPIAVVVLSAHDDYHLVRDAFKLGATDYLLKRELDVETLGAALTKAASGLAPSSERTQAILQRRQLGLLKAQVLGDLLAAPASPGLEETFPGLGITIVPPFAVCCFWVEDLEAVSRRERDDGMARFSEMTTRSLQQALAAAGRGEVVPRGPGHAVVLFSPPAPAQVPLELVARTFCEDAADYVARYLNVKLTFSVGPVCASLRDAPDALSAARIAHKVESRIVVLAKRAIHERFSDPEFSLEAASARAGVSKNHLSFEFSRETGETFTEYVARVRIEEAKRLLATTELLVYEVGAHVGYPSVEHFSRVFKKVAGVSPVKFRAGFRAPGDLP